MHAREPRRLSLAQLPTPLVELKNLSKALSIPRLLIKRDDLTGLEVSGNKIRKLEYILADVLAAGADTVVTNGDFQSNHCRATAAAAARLGLRAHLVLRARDAEPANDGNLFLDRLFGAQITLVPAHEYAARRFEHIEAVMDAERAAGRKPYYIPVGGSIPLGCWGYIRCVWELIEQLGLDTPVDIFCATSSCGTHVGLMLGVALLGCRKWRVLGVPVSDDRAYFERELRRLERQTTAEFNIDLEPEATPIELIDGFVGEGYAIPYPAAVETIRLVARTEGILLDPVYTSKAMTGCLTTLERGGIRDGAVPVFIHTGGSWGLMARRDLF